MPVDFRLTYQMGKVWRALVLVALSVLATNVHSASKTIVVLGDSLSAEYGLAHGSGWVSLLQKKLAAEKRTDVIVNASISGETSSGGNTRLPALLDKYHPAIVVIELGANDALRGLPLQATSENLQTMIRNAKKSGAKVLLIGMQIPPNYGGDYTRQFADLFPQLAAKTKSSLVPFMLRGVADRPELFQADRMHPTAQAHPIILDNIWPRLKPLLAK